METNPQPVKALALETSGKIGSIALVYGTKVILAEHFSQGANRATELLPLIDRSMKLVGWKPAELAYIFVSQGPGSFTGLRIGITLAKVIALATGAKVIAVPSLRVIAQNAPTDVTNVMVILDAKRDQIFSAQFVKINGGWIESESAHLDTLVASLARAPRPIYLMGEGIPYHEKFLLADRAGIQIAQQVEWQGRASTVASLGLELLNNVQSADIAQLVPAYVRKPEAQEKYEMLHGVHVIS